MQYITDMPGLMKTDTGAIILIDLEVYQDSMRIHESHKSDKLQIKILEQTVDDMKQSIDNLTKLVEQLINK